MEPTSGSSGLSLPKDLRPKQIEIIEACAKSAQVVAKVPTGYGKTRAGEGAYATRKHLGLANRLLWIVPRDAQAAQAAEDIPEELREDYGITSSALIVGQNPIQALQAHRRGTCEVFIATIQSLVSERALSTYQELCSTGLWFKVVDEHHHFANGKTWAKRIEALPVNGTLAMSATPKRPDTVDFFPEPTIVETYYGAANAGYIKKLSLHAYEYAVDAVTVDGTVIRFSTSDLVQQAGGDAPEQIDEFMAKRKMRWSPKYLSPLIQFPFERLIDLRVRNVRSQMLIQAMSCSHASMICKQAEALLDDRATVDWVGTGPSGRTDAENRAVLKRFCPAKDRLTKRREWDLDILVNVGMAGEGLDTTDVSEIIFLTPANITNSNLQIIGRGARIMPNASSVICHVNVDTDSPMGEHIGAKVMELFDDGVEIIEPTEELGEQRDYKEMPDEMEVVIVDVRLTDIKQDPLYERVLEGLTNKNRPEMSEEQAERLSRKHAEEVLRELRSRGNNQSAIIAQERQQVHSAVNKVVSLFMRRIAETGARIEKTMAGDISKRIRGKLKSMYGRIEEADEEILKQQYRWLKELEKGILLDQALQGAPRWLL